MMKTIALLLLCAVLSGCGSTLVVLRPASTGRVGHIGQKVRVVNPELEREFQILRAAEIYDISTDPTAASLSLAPIQSNLLGCANPFFLSVVTLGILPVSFQSDIIFCYSIEDRGEISRFDHFIPAYKRYSIWEHFISDNSDSEIAEALKECKKKESI
jgi:hypothetical protein